MHLSSKAIVINCMRYRESSLIVKIFTEERGLLSFIIRNANTKKRNLSAIYQPLTILHVESFLKENNTLHHIKEAQVVDPVHNIHKSQLKIGVAMFMAEILYKTLDEEDPNPALFHYLLYAIHWLDQAPKYANFPIAFLVNLSKYYGFPPKTPKGNNHDFFDLRDGVFLTSAPLTHPEFLTKELSQNLQLFLGTNFDGSSSIKLDQQMRKSLLEQMINYFKIHLEKLRDIQSHIVLEETFNV